MQNINAVKHEVRRLVREGYLPDEIARIVGRRLSKTTLKQYIKVAYAEARREGFEIKRAITHAPSEKPLSALHSRVGIRLAGFRTSRALNPAEFSNDFAIGNRKTIVLMEHGLYEFTLTELQQIAALLGSDIGALVQPHQEKERQMHAG